MSLTPNKNDQSNSPDLSLDSPISKSYIDTPLSLDPHPFLTQSDSSNINNNSNNDDDEIKEKILNTEKQLVFISNYS